MSLVPNPKCATIGNCRPILYRYVVCGVYYLFAVAASYYMMCKGLEIFVFIGTVCFGLDYVFFCGDHLCLRSYFELFFRGEDFISRLVCVKAIQDGVDRL